MHTQFLFLTESNMGGVYAWFKHVSNTANESNLHRPLLSDYRMQIRMTNKIYFECYAS